MKKLIFLMAFAAINFAVFAQEAVKLAIADAVTGKAITDATVLLNKQAVTGNNSGVYSIPANGGELTVSRIGYRAASVRVGNAKSILVKLTPLDEALDAVEITATSNQNKSLLYQPASITKLSPIELRRGTGLFLDDAIIQNVPGVTMNRRTVSAGQQFNIRGYGNGSRGTRGVSSNFDGQGYKVYLNGIPVTDAEGITTLDDIDFGSVGNVEVVKGPSGTLYGLAIAGVVSLKTVKPEKGKTSIGQEALVGNYNLQRYTTQFATAGERSSLLVNYGHQKTEGYTIHNNSKKNFVNAVAEFTPNAKQTVNAYFGYSNSYDERSGELSIEQWDANDYSGNIEYIKRNGHSNVYTFRAGVGHTYQFNNNIANTTSLFGTSFTSNASSAGGWTDKLALNIGARSTFDTKFSVGNGATLSGITGVEAQRQNAQTIGYTMVKNPLDPAATWTYGNPYYWIIGASTSNLYSVTSTSSLFTEWTLALPNDFSVTAGVGWSNMKITLDDRFYVANKPTHYDTAYHPGLSPHVAINKVFSKALSAYASYNRAYKAPVSSYFYVPFVSAVSSETGIVNRYLKPEMGDQYEIGTKGSLLNGKLNYQVALFEAVFNDKFTTKNVVNAAGTATLYSYVFNGGKQTHKGVEALLKTIAYQSSTGFLSAVMPFANLTYSDFKYNDYPFSVTGVLNKDSIVNYNGKQVAGVAKWVTNIGFDFATRPGIYGNLAYLYRDPFTLTSDGLRNNVNPAVPYHVSSYSLLNAKLGYRHSLSRHFDLDTYFGVNNIAGTKYPIMVFVNQLPDAFIAGPAKAVYFGSVNLKYNF